MSLRDQAAADFAAVVALDGDAVTLGPTGTEYTVRAQVTRIDAMIDPQTGVQVTEPKLAVSIALSALAADPAEGWIVNTTDVTGAELARRVAVVRFDRSLGLVNLICEAYADA